MIRWTDGVDSISVESKEGSISRIDTLELEELRSLSKSKSNSGTVSPIPIRIDKDQYPLIRKDMSILDMIGDQRLVDNVDKVINDVNVDKLIDDVSQEIINRLFNN